MSDDLTTLSLDLGSTMGYAYGKNGVITRSGEVSLYVKDTHPGHRFLRFQQWLEQYRTVGEILFEDVPRFESAGAAKVYCGLLSILSIFSLVHNIRAHHLLSNTVKKDFAGHGNARKEEMCDIARRLGWKKGRDGTADYHNECDAISLFWVIFKRRGLEPSFLATPDTQSLLDVKENSAVA